MKGTEKMNLIECVKSRRSVRKFLDKKVPQEEIKEIIEIASFSPSWKNTQIVRYTYVEDKNKLENIAENHVLGFTFNTATIKNAPAMIVVTMIEKRSGFEKDGSFSTPKEDRFEMFDAGVASQTFCLAANDRGLGTVILGYFDEVEIKKILDIPNEQKIACLIPIGYPAETLAAPKRKTVDDLLTIK